MKKARWITMLALIAMLFAFALAGCNEKVDKVTSVALKDHDPNTAIEIALGEFDYNQYTVVVSYESGSVEEMTLTEEMITATDLFKLYQVGDHEITFGYGEQKYTFKVSVKRATFEELSFPEDTVFVYDGKAHTVEVDGDIPAGAIVNYPTGNSFVNAGTYGVTAVVSCEGYVTEKLTTTVKIERAKYDMSGVKFEDKEVVYDGTSHSVAISGTLPEGVSSPMYTIADKNSSSATDAGEYRVKATFANNDPNYESIPEMVATLKINPAKYSIKGVDLVFQNKNGAVISGSRKIYDDKTVTFDLNDYKKLSKKISVSFSVFDKDGKKLSISNKDTEILNAGVYTVKAEFKHADSKNYEPIEPLVRTFEVLKADHPPIENIQFVSTQIIYDGAPHSITFGGTLPQGVTVSCNYYLNDTLVVDGEGNPVRSVVDAGRYTVKAVFSHDNENYKEISPISAILNIEQAPIDTSTLIFDYNENWVYDRTPKSVTVTNPPNHLAFSYEYYRNGTLVTNGDGTPAAAVTDVGEYTVFVYIKATNKNYISMELVTLSFSIVAQNS